jgi:hypothetical protein
MCPFVIKILNLVHRINRNKLLRVRIESIILFVNFGFLLRRNNISTSMYNLKFSQRSCILRHKNEIRSRSTPCNRISLPLPWCSSQGHLHCWAAVHASCPKCVHVRTPIHEHNVLSISAVSSNNPRSLEELKQHIEQSVANIDPEKLRKVARTLKRVEACLREDSAHFPHFNICCNS